MLGASIGLAIDKGLNNPTWWTVIAIITLVLHTVNFYHGKTAALFDVNELIRSDARPIVRVSSVLANTLLFLVFCGMAAKITNPYAIVIGELCLRVIDMGIVGAQLRLFDKSPGKTALDPDVTEQLWYWQKMNLLVFIVFGAIAIGLHYVPVPAQYPIVVSVFSALVAVDLIREYTTYSRNYFATINDWDILSQRWDRLQGELGDLFRQRILHPFVTKILASEQSSIVVDLGAGNGCTARWIADHNPSVSFVLAIDRSERLLELATMYEARKSRGLQYVAEEIDSILPTRMMAALRRVRVTHSQRVTFISLFGAQDCDDTTQFFRNMKLMALPGDLLLLIFETPASFDPNSSHTTTVRTWKWSLNPNERIQVVSWLPVAEGSPSSVAATQGLDSGEIITTTTRLRLAADFQALGDSHGFSAEGSDSVPFHGARDTPALMAYVRSPKFAYLLLRRMK